MLRLIPRLLIMIVNIGRARAHTTTTKAPFKTVIYFIVRDARRSTSINFSTGSRPYHNYDNNDNSDDNISLIHIGRVKQKDMRRIPLPQPSTNHTFIHDYIMCAYLYVELTTVD